ncbi:agmatine deiminase family protein [Hymenobacter sp. UYP22]|uniref:agmatine deiminase family protein n=1 Tax=Hymenobacter sp. UYP22 TaxID=3156348 RepID=UPI003390E788
MHKAQQQAPVYVADTLVVRYPGAARALQAAVEAAGRVQLELAGTRDVWVRDFMPVSTGDGSRVLFRYYPEYLRPAQWRATITDAAPICQALGVSVRTSDLVVDGGNVVWVGRRAVLTDRVFSDNAALPAEQVRRRLLEELRAEELIIVPAHPQDFTGHVDGMLFPVDAQTVLLSAYPQEKPAFREELHQALQRAGIAWQPLPYNPYANPTFTDAAGEYANALRLNATILIPVFGRSEDEEALRCYERAFPHCSVQGVAANELARDGGALHCVTWTG